MLTAVVVTLILSSAFTTKSYKKIKSEDLSYYFFIEASASKNSSDYNKTRYVSDYIHYEGYESCRETYTFEKKAKKAFEDYLRANESYEGNPSFIRVISGGSNDKLQTRQAIQQKMNKYLGEEKNKDHEVIKTNFSYSCE